MRPEVSADISIFLPEAVIILSFVTPFYSLCHCEERVYERRGNPRINLFYFGLLRLLKKPRNDMVCIFYFYFYCIKKIIFYPSYTFISNKLTQIKKIPEIIPKTE